MFVSMEQTLEGMHNFYDDPDLIAGSAFAGDVCMQVSEYVAELAITKTY